jgi:hypothetical protein
MNKPTVISFFTPDWQYSARAIELMTDCDRMGIAHHIKPRESRDTWNQNTAMKPAFILEALEQFEHVIWMDCDGKLIQPPALCLEHADQFPDADILAVPHQTMPRDWHVGILSIRRNPKTLAFVEDWAKTARDRDMTDELAFDQIYKKHDLSIQELPKTYHRVIRKGVDLDGAVWAMGISMSPSKLAMKERNRRQ